MKWIVPRLAAGMVMALSLVAGIIVMGPLPVPGLLAGAKSAGGTEMKVCPSASDFLVDSTSPDINHRLQKRFPPGTSELALIEALKQEGFHIHVPCLSNPSIRGADFGEDWSHRLSLCSQVSAHVYWKRDDSGHSFNPGAR